MPQLFRVSVSLDPSELGLSLGPSAIQIHALPKYPKTALKNNTYVIYLNGFSAFPFTISFEIKREILEVIFIYVVIPIELQTLGSSTRLLIGTT